MKIALVLSLWMLIIAGVAFGDEPPAIMGDWSGGYIQPPKGCYQDLNPTLAGEVVGVKNGHFAVHLFTKFDRRAEWDFNQTIKLQDGALNYANGAWKITVSDNLMKGSLKIKHKNNDVEIPFELKKVSRLSPTLGRPAPQGADVLFEKAALDQWEHKSGGPATWSITPEGFVECIPSKHGDLLTKKSYKDCELHLEFRMPYEPNNEGQNRGNSGLFIQSHYEVQVLDSYGVNAGWTDCGSLYRVSPAKINMCAPPRQWQTYDVIFRAARFDASGKLTEFPVITVRHNGKLIHHEQVLEELTQYTEAGRQQAHIKEAKPFKLQDHGHRVQFRNFWVLPLAEDKK